VVQKISTGRQNTFGVSKSCHCRFRALFASFTRKSTMVATSSNGGDATPRAVAQRPVGQAQQQRKPQPRAAAWMSTSRCASPFGRRNRASRPRCRAGPTAREAREARARVSSTLRRPRRLSAARRTILCGLWMPCGDSPCRALCSPLAGKAPHSTGPQV